MILSYHLLYSTLRIFVNKSFKSANAIYSGYFTQKCYYNFHFDSDFSNVGCILLINSCGCDCHVKSMFFLWLMKGNYLEIT